MFHGISHKVDSIFHWFNDNCQCLAGLKAIMESGQMLAVS